MYEDKSLARSSRPFFNFCLFLCRYRQICDVKWSILKFYRESKHATLNYCVSTQSEICIFVKNVEACLTSASSDEATNFCTLYVQKQKLCTLFTSFFLFLYIFLSLSANLRRKHVTLNYCVSIREWNLHTSICVQPWSVNVFFFCACLFFKRDSFPDNCDDWTNENVSFGARQTMNFHWSNHKKSSTRSKDGS